MPYAVTLRLDDASAVGIEAIWDRLAAAGVSDAMKRLAYRPHLTLAIAERIDVAATTGALRRFAAGLAPVPARFAGLGSFTQPACVLWAAPTVDRALLDLHASLHGKLGWPAHAHYRVGAWVPHCTLAEGLSAAALGRAVEVAATAWQPLNATLDRIDLVRFRPVEILWQQPLRSHARIDRNRP